MVERPSGSHRLQNLHAKYSSSVSVSAAVREGDSAGSMCSTVSRMTSLDSDDYSTSAARMSRGASFRGLMSRSLTL